MYILYILKFCICRDRTLVYSMEKVGATRNNIREIINTYDVLNEQPHTQSHNTTNSHVCVCHEFNWRNLYSAVLLLGGGGGGCSYFVIYSYIKFS